MSASWNKNIIRHRIAEFLFLFSSIFIIPAFLYSKALITIAIIGFVISGLLSVTSVSFKSTIAPLRLLLFSLVFLSVVLSGINSADTSAWLEASIIKLPFLLLPIAFILRPTSTKYIIPIHLWLLAVLVISAIPQTIFILKHYSLLIDNLGRGQPIPTPVEHVKYSMFNAYGVVSAIYLLLFKSAETKHSRSWIWAGVITLFVFMHLLAVRTGLVIAYASILILGIAYARQQGGRKIWAILLGICLMGPLSAYLLIPSIKQKANYMMHDWKMYQSDKGENYADSQRLMMARAAIEIWREAPVIGTGYGDLKETSRAYYREHFNLPDLDKLPHNQYLITIAGSGLIGLILFLIGFYGPLMGYRGVYRALLLLLYLNFTLSFLVENSLERSVSVAFFLFFSLLILSSNLSIPQADEQFTSYR